MSAISPIGVLPQSTFLDFTPTVLPEPDFKTLFAIQKEQTDAIQFDKRMKFQEKKEMWQGMSDFFTKTDGLYTGDNPWQNEQMKTIAEAREPLFRDLERNIDSGDVEGFYANRFKYQQQMATNPGIRESEAQKKRHAINLALIGRDPNIDPEKVNAYLRAYTSWDGTTPDPTLNFNPSSMKTYNLKDEEDFLDNMGRKNILDFGDGTKGVQLLDPEEFTIQAKRFYEAKGRGSGLEEDDFISQLAARYYKGSNGQYRILTGDKSGGSTGDGTGTKTDKSDASPYSISSTTGLPMYNNPKYKDESDSKINGAFAESASIIQSPIAISAKLREDNSNLKIRYDQVLKEKEKLINSGAVTGTKNKDGSYTYKYKNDDVKKKHTALMEEQREIGKQLKENKGIVEEVKKSGFYSSKDYETVAKSIRMGETSSFASITSPGLEGADVAIYPNIIGNSAEEKRAAQLANEQVYDPNESFKTRFQTLPGTRTRMIKFRELTKDYRKSPEDYMDRLNTLAKGKDKGMAELAKLELNAVQKKLEGSLDTYTASNPDSQSRYTTSEFTANSDDRDFVETKKKYQDNSVASLTASGTEVYLSSTGRKYEGSDDEYLNIKTIRWSPNANAYVYVADAGVAKKKKDTGENAKNNSGTGPAFEGKTHEVEIRDPGLNNMMYDMRYGQYPKGYAAVAQSISEGIGRTADVSSKKAFRGELAGKKYTVYKDGNKYHLKMDGEEGLEDKDFSRDQIISTLVDYSYRVNQQQSTSGSNMFDYKSYFNKSQGSGGVSDGGGKPLQEKFKFIADIESGGLKEPYLAINRVLTQTGTSTNAMGKYQFLPTSYGDKIQNWMKNYDSKPISDTEVKEFFNKTFNLKGRDNSKAYDIEHLRSYYNFLHNPEAQEEFMNNVYENEYKDQAVKVMAAYKNKGKPVTEAQAVYLIHYNGFAGAMKANKNPMVGKDAVITSHEEIKKSKINYQDSNIYNYQENQKRIFEKYAKPEFRDDLGHFMEKSGLLDMKMDMSSSKKEGGAHERGEAVDFKFNPKDEDEVLRKIAKWSSDPEGAFKALKKKSVHHYIDIKLKSTGRKIRVIYHQDSDKNGYHLHIQRTNV